MEKGLIFGLIAVLSAPFLVIGCGQTAGRGGSAPISVGGCLVDIEAESEAGFLVAG
jgi:hypothetical protein